jgi:nucleoside-diphosphate-sugar epimerase
VLGPHAVGGKVEVSAHLKSVLQVAWKGLRALPVPVPDMPIQFIHEDDVGRALLQCVVAAGPPGAYNIAADDVLSLREVARELGVFSIPVPAAPARLAARLVAHLPFLPRSAQWVEAMSHPAIMDTSRARSELHWTPEFSALESLRASVR